MASVSATCRRNRITVPFITSSPTCSNSADSTDGSPHRQSLSEACGKHGEIQDPFRCNPLQRAQDKRNAPSRRRLSVHFTVGSQQCPPWQGPYKLTPHLPTCFRPELNHTSFCNFGPPVHQLTYRRDALQQHKSTGNTFRPAPHRSAHFSILVTASAYDRH